MNILLVVGIVGLVSWFSAEIAFRLIRYLENAIIATGSFIVAAAALYVLIALA